MAVLSAAATVLNAATASPPPNVRTLEALRGQLTWHYVHRIRLGAWLSKNLRFYSFFFFPPP